MTIKVNQITDAAGTGPVEFPFGLVLPSLNSYVRVRGATGQVGSTLTTVRYLHTSSFESSGSDITYSSDSTNGSSFTINTAGLYYVSYQDNRQTGPCTYAVGLNSTTIPSSLAQADMFAYLKTAQQADAKLNISGLRLLSAGDVLYPLVNQTSGFSGADFECAFIITRIY